MKKLIKWAYFKYVYPEEIDRAYRHLEDGQSVESGIKKLRENNVVFDVSSHGSIVVSPSEYQSFLKKKIMYQALTERAWIPDDGLH